MNIIHKLEWIFVAIAGLWWWDNYMSNLAGAPYYWVVYVIMYGVNLSLKELKDYLKELHSPSGNGK